MQHILAKYNNKSNDVIWPYLITDNHMPRYMYILYFIIMEWVQKR